MTDVELAETRTRVDVAVENLRHARVGPIAVLARTDSTLFDAISLGLEKTVAAQELLKALSR